MLAELGADHALVVHGSDGLDELTTTGASRVAEVRDGEVSSYEIDPAEIGVPIARPKDLAGGSSEDNAAMLRAVLAGSGGPLAEVTALNAGAAIYVGGFASDLAAGLERACEALATGAAERKLGELAAFR